MPSWPVHIAIANKLNKKLNLGDEFIVGNVLPDVLNGYIIEKPSEIISSKITHFKEENKLENFIKNNNLTDHLILGYITHILTDNYFNKYFHQHHLKIENGKKIAILKDQSLSLDSQEKPWRIKQQDFEIYGQKLSNDGLLGQKINYVPNGPNIFTIKKSDIKKAVNKINELIENKYKYNNNLYKMFTEKELDKLYNECYQFLLDFLKQI